VGNPEKEPLCTVKELLVFGVICVVYSSVLFSVDPEWVAWAAPLVFGGALCATDPPPASAHLGSPHDVFPVAYLYNVLALLCLVLLTSPWFGIGGTPTGCHGSVPKQRFRLLQRYEVLLTSKFRFSPGRWTLKQLGARILHHVATTRHSEERVAALCCRPCFKGSRDKMSGRSLTSAGRNASPVVQGSSRKANLRIPSTSLRKAW
jgi:hypothetical protein